MAQAILPYLLYILLQAVVLAVGVNLTPAPEMDRLCGSRLLKTYISGQMLLWGALQVLAVPMIHLRLSFSALYFAFLAVAGLLALLGLLRFWKLRKNITVPSVRAYFKSLSRPEIILLIVVVLLIALQFFAYFLGMHLDEDDARWLAEANDAVEYGQMMMRNPSTGEYVGRSLSVKDAAAPWPMFFAVLSKLFHLSSAVVAHTLYAPTAILLSYGIYCLISKELFAKEASRWIFLLMVVVINLFYAGTVFTQSVFSLVRIWQGKATVAAIIIPLLLYLFICINRRNETSDWVLLAVSGFGSCLMSGMGISMAGIMIGVYGIYSIIAYRRWNRIPLWILAMAPTVAYSLFYFYLKG